MSPPAPRAAMAQQLDPGESGGPHRDALLRRLVRRLTFGATADELALADALGYEGYLDHHLAPDQIDDSACDARLNAYASIFLDPSQLWSWSDVVVILELAEASIVRAVYSKRQLFERVVELWTDHFNIWPGKALTWDLLPIDRRTVVRGHALARFPDLLKHEAQSAAMLYYLDNHLSVKGAPNENYARELLELHSMGADQGYTQQDVSEVARCLTGWELTSIGSAPGSGTFRFNASRHDDDAKVVLGQVIPPGGGLQDGLTVLDLLGRHPSTARLIAWKLCRHLLGEPIPTGALDAVATTYRATGGDITAMVRTALRPRFLAAAPPKLKRPFHLLVSVMRAVPTQINAPANHLRERFRANGHLPFDWPQPNGAPDRTSAWAPQALPRWNFAAELLEGVIWDAVMDTSALFAGVATARDVVDRIDAALHGGPMGGQMPPNERAELVAYAAVAPTNATRQRETLALAFAAPSFQWF